MSKTNNNYNSNPNIINQINERTEKMIKKGAVKEVKGFLRLNIREDNSSYKIRLCP